MSLQKVIVVGGGPVGALSALYAARRGYEVELYDLRDDPNYGDPNARPDIAVIPLALSERGIRAIEGAGVPGLLDEILANLRPIYTRLIHVRNKSGSHKTIPMIYGPQGQLSWGDLLEEYSSALMKEPTAKLFFNHRISSCDFEKKVATFDTMIWKGNAEVTRKDLTHVAEDEPRVNNTSGEEKKSPSVKEISISSTRTVNFDFLIGADGTYSTVRQFMMRKLHMDFSQQYLDALWCDFFFPPADDGSYRMNSTGLLVWPADESIIMCQPDFDGSFRAGMVCATDKVRHYEAHPEEFADFFDQKFPGIVGPLLSKEDITSQFVKNLKIPLKSVKTGKLGYKDNAVLLGDSSHTMTPFHAMGMITGLEDVRIFFQDFRDPRVAAAQSSGSTEPLPFCVPGTVQAYSEFRLPDVHAMVDMAASHYHELRIGVRSASARAKKIIEAWLSR
ncbi:Kynurenine 3-monooxygenase [Pyrenophora tritici-repentis]|uniref:Kynurenine 3-monooxygenase n=1 Tax=Pyrenophora tritici-repentis (strain Pt-1C-BFP) TaxID=426418 RepID=B2WGP6_PYRTR|nr:kynurenine 3-monooxygenase [Pyrenophora tritici-repentis Pt-1C-BFP]EDU42153.1 kynurenine 3-monooxygenase [Pyrenophora tritici-repentis Pt-1C-BFP]KAI0612958.1 Kynurenine 3-monooxygenase [Pyrenophora tritici-repentis]PWO26290.1 hypothetical protein PtrARCrB10_05169 [Pyrenophora tritici-repentis]